MRRLLAAASALAFGVGAADAAICLDRTSYERTLVADGKTVAFVGRIDAAGVKVFVAVSAAGAWTVFWTRDGMMMCEELAGSGWTPQGEIPRRDIRP